MIARRALFQVMLVLGLCTATHCGAEPPALNGWMTTPTPRPGDWLKHHQRLVAQAQAGGIDVLFLGDSITENWSNMGQTPWKKHFAPLKAANFGISSDGTQNLLWRLLNGELEVMKPRVVVLLIGTNNIPWTYADTTPAVAAEQVFEAIQLLISTVQARQPAARILLLGILPRGQYANTSRETIRLVNAKLAGLDSDRIRYFDSDSLFLAGEHLPPSIMPDGLHPNARGYALWAPALVPAVKNLLSQTR